MIQYGTVYLQEAYEAQGLQKQDAQDHLADLQLFSNILSTCSAMIFGLLADKIQIHKLVNIINVILLTFGCLMVYDMRQHDEEWFGTLFDISFVIISGIKTCLFMLGTTIISKVCDKTTRGTIFTFYGMIGSTGILIVQGLGGTGYNSWTKTFPFDMSLSVILFFAILNAILGCIGKMKI